MFIIYINSFVKGYFLTIFYPIFKYLLHLSINVHAFISLLGFIIVIVIINQLISGILLALSLIPESMMISNIREEEDSENLYIEDLFWFHERGVDIFFITLLSHLIRKLFIKISLLEHENSWKTGIILFYLSHVVIFFGLVLCCTHLSEITLTIAVNIIHTFFFFKGKIYWLIFTDMLLNTDTLVRLAYLHYISSFMLFLFSIFHGIEMHYDWRGELIFYALYIELSWYYEGLLMEMGTFIKYIFLINLCCIYLFTLNEALSYEYFMWGDIGIVNDIRFYSVAPHWYFRPYMAWLIICPFHKLGLSGLILFFISLYFHTILIQNIFIYINFNIIYLFIYYIFLNLLMYTLSFLPFGRFYNQINGNIGMLVAYLYIYIYLSSAVISLNILLIKIIL